MEKLIFQKAIVRNFLTYGNEPQTIEFFDGMTLITGFDENTNKSNGSGKTSVTEVIPFALFGKTIKDVPQSDIVNWNNRSGCSVELYFSKDDNTYRILRKLKPNKLHLFKNDVEYVRSADVREFQAMIEEEIIGMDFKTFKNLIHYSPNNTISIIGAPKAQKRAFLESLFDLSDYSGMLKLVNSKSSELSNKSRDAEMSIENSEQNIKDIQRDIDNSEEMDTTDEKKQLKKLMFSLESFQEMDITDPSDKLEVRKIELETVKESKAEMDVEIGEIKSSIRTLLSSENVDIDKLQKDADDKVSKITDIEKFIADNPDNSYEISSLIKEKESLKEQVDGVQDELQNTKKHLYLLTNIVSSCRDEIDDIKDRTDGVGDKDVCDYCGSNITHDKVLDWRDTNIRSQQSRIDSAVIDIESREMEQEALTIKIRDINTKIKSIDDEIENRRNTEKTVTEKKNNLKLLKSSLSVIHQQIEDARSIFEKIELMKKQLGDIQTNYDLVKQDIKDKTKIVNDIIEEYNKFREHEKRIDDLKSDIVSINKTLEMADRVNADRKKVIKEKTERIETLKESISENRKKIKNTNLLIDHLDHMRKSLKDENVKQFAISSFLPYLNQQANMYLSESGFPYTIKLDGWLDVQIMGMGTEDINYKSLSGGETKALDMSVQIACNDIAELQAKTTLNVSIYDEILDTSLDEDGVERVMSVIKSKQDRNHGCVLVITHKEEIKAFDFDRYIKVIKRDGFSVIE